MGARKQSKPAPVSGRNRGRDAVSGEDRLCKLDLPQTIAATAIPRVQNLGSQLEESRDNFALLYERSPIGYVTLDQRGHIHDVNTAVLDLSGFTRERLVQLPFSFLVHRDDLKRMSKHLERCENSQESRVVTELRLRIRGQSFLPIQLVSVPSTPVNGRKTFLTAVVDLTERSKNEQTVAEAREFAEAIVETVRHPLVVLDSDFRIVSVNRAFTQFFKRSAQFAKGRVFETLLNLWWSGNELRNELDKVLVRNEPLDNYEIAVEPPDLGRRVLLLNARRLYQKQRSQHLLVVLEDITEREQAREELRKANEELELRVAGRTEALRKSYEQMEAFCYSIAHDLRAPLRSISGFSHLLGNQFRAEIGEAGTAYTSRIQQSAERMDKLIRDLLQYGRLNTIDLPVQEVDLEHVFCDVVAQLDNEIEERRAQIRKDEALPRVNGNRVVLQVALANLLANALKFVPPDIVPEITVSAEDRRTCIRVCVADNGIGIAPENHGKIFGVFQRLHQTDCYPGTGIGLALVSKGLERIGGRVGVDSELGKGSRFWIEMKACVTSVH